jgi:hypothetical protein
MTYRSLVLLLPIAGLLALLCLGIGGAAPPAATSADDAPVDGEASVEGDEPDQFLQGDSDCSEAIDVADVVTILEQSTELGTAPCALATDVDCDGLVGPLDALKLLGAEAGVLIATSSGACADWFE